MERLFTRCFGAVLAVTLLSLSATPGGAGDDRAAQIRDALSAAPPEIAKNATVHGWDGAVLKAGTNGWVCYPTSAGAKHANPMCLDAAWRAWAKAWMGKTKIDKPAFGISYMLAGDAGVSNIDPYATTPTPDNQWVQEGPHLMILVPDPAMLDQLPTDPNNGGPYVMWKGTPYVHIMVPVASR